MSDYVAMRQEFAILRSTLQQDPELAEMMDVVYAAAQGPTTTKHCSSSEESLEQQHRQQSSNEKQLNQSCAIARLYALEREIDSACAQIRVASEQVCAQATEQCVAAIEDLSKSIKEGLKDTVTTPDLHSVRPQVPALAPCVSVASHDHEGPEEFKKTNTSHF